MTIVEELREHIRMNGGDPEGIRTVGQAVQALRQMDARRGAKAQAKAAKPAQSPAAEG